MSFFGLFSLLSSLIFSDVIVVVMVVVMFVCVFKMSDLVIVSWCVIFSFEGCVWNML